MIMYRKAFHEIFFYFDGLIDSVEFSSKVRKKHLEWNVEVALKWTTIFLSFVTIGGLIVNCYDLYETNFSSPMRFLIPGLSRSSIFFFPANIIFQVTLYFAILHVIMGSDAVIMITICYFRSENQAVVEFIEQLDESEIVQKNCNGIFRNIYEVHQTVTWNMKKLLEGYWHIYFYKLFTIILYLCTLLFIFQSVNISMMIVLLCALIVTAQIFILCFFGQLLRNSSEAIAEALYMTKWYEMGIEDQKNLLLLLLRFQKAVKIEAFGFGTISIYTFVQIIKAAASYASIAYTIFK
ncbi:odorant receptor 4-like [Phlebotomus papatasi]|nr:odorant receptor 4-like [Phlebotomus papatasi]